MNYISLIDELGLDLESISAIDSQAIIRLQKQLKAKAILNGDSNLGETSHLIDSLKDQNIRDCHIYIEKHIWLKKLLLGEFNDIYSTDFNEDPFSLEDFDNLRSFLEPYLYHQMKPFLSEMLSKGNYNILLNTLYHNFLFSEQIHQIIINFFKSKLTYAQIYLSEGKLQDKHFPIAYISNKTFINCLNVYPNSFSDEINEVNSEVIRIYNKNRQNTSDSTFLFCARVMVAFGLLDLSNEYLKDILVSNATIARQWANPQIRRQKSSSGLSPWSIIFIIFLVIKVIHFASKSSSSSNSFNSYPYDSFKVNYQHSASDNNLKTLNMINYIYPMMSNKSTTTQASEFPLVKYQNPYEQKFYRFYGPKTDSDISRNMTYIKNKTNKDLILFLLYKNDDKSVFIPQNDSIVIQIEARDTLVFYSGNNFVSRTNSNIRFFNEDRHMSQLYIIDSINVSEPHDIDVYPEIANNANNTNGVVKKIDSVRLRNIAYEKKEFATVISTSDMINLNTN